MVQCGKHHIVSDLAAVAECYATVVLKMAAGIDEDVLSDGYVLAEIGVKRRKYPKGLRNAVSE